VSAAPASPSSPLRAQPSPMSFRPISGECATSLQWPPVHAARLSMVDRASSGHELLTKSTIISYCKIILKPENPHHLTNNPLYLSIIKPQSTFLVNRTLGFKNIYRYTPSYFQKFQQFLGPKFLESLPLSSYAFIKTCLLHFIDSLCCFALGNIVLEPFFEDF
jgi:hypothetical protein